MKLRLIYSIILNEKTIEVLLGDDEFFQWLMDPTKELDNYWNEIMSKDPDIRENVLQIKKALTRFRVREPQMSETEKALIWTKIEKECFGKRESYWYKPYLKIAAAVVGIAFLMTPGYFILRQQHSPEEGKSIDYTAIVNRSEPERNMKNVRLILSNSKELILSDDKCIDLVYENDSSLHINSQKINIDNFSQTGSDKPRLNQLIVPYGKISSVILRDGTKVWVNAGSRIIYPTVFADNKREIFVEGEAFLDVTKDEKRPFIVKTALFDIQVLGTSFNVSVYKGEPSQSVVLVTGSLQVSNETSRDTSRIKPNQMYLYRPGRQEVSTKEVDIYDHICWKYGFLHFQSEKLGTVFLQLQRHYNIRMDYDKTKANNIIISGKLDLKKEIDLILESISLTAPIKYEIRENNIKIEVK